MSLARALDLLRRHAVLLLGVPVSILMALLGYALGNYLAPLAGNLARLAAGQ